MQTGNGIDEATYDATKDYLKAALEQMMAVRQSVEDVAEFAATKFGDGFFPYVREFQQDIRAGRTRIQRLAESSKADIFSGTRVNPEERERMIREAAYLRAERRGFADGSPEKDWLAAEAQVDEMLASKLGVSKGGNDASAAKKPKLAKKKSAASKKKSAPARQKTAKSGGKKSAGREMATAQNPVASSGRRTSPGKTKATRKRSAGRSGRRDAPRK